MTEANEVRREEAACILFTTTHDLNAEFPAVAARELGWTDVALLCGQEIDVPSSLPMCLRILILFNTEKPPQEIVHVYLRGAKELKQNHSNVKRSVE